MTQPEPFTYTDPDGDTLTVSTTTRFGSTALSLLVQRPDVPEASAAVHVPLADTEQVVAAIRTAAGAQQPEPEERRGRFGQVIRKWGLLDEVNSPEVAEHYVVSDLLAVADEEQQELRAELHDARTLAARRESELIGRRAATTRLRAELGQARGTTGQDTTGPADGEQETRQQIARALHRYDTNQNLSRTDAPSGHHLREADAVLPVVRAAVAAGVRRALEDAREQLLFDAGLRAAEEEAELAEYGRELAELVVGASAHGAVASPAREHAYPERHLWEVQVLIPGRPWRTLSSGYEDLAAARERAEAADDTFRDVRIVRAATTYTTEPTA